MKKIMIYSLSVLALLSLTACSNKNNAQEQSSSSKATSSTSQSSASKGSSSTASSSSSVSMKTEEGVKSDLGQARLALYEAGVNSSQISDDDLLKYWKEAKDQKLDFVQYVKNKTK